MVTVHEEKQYLSIIEKILVDGTSEEGRNGQTISTFGEMMRFSLKDGTIPIFTTKKVAWKTCLKELLWFISGDTNNKTLTDQGVHIWDENCPPDTTDLGPIYGHQWRHFNAPYKTDKKGIDQLQYVIDKLKDPRERYSRRIIMSAWNPEQLDQMALPPCHILCQFNVSGNKLSCSLYQRSGDMGLGVPFNVASYSFLTHLLAAHCGLVAHEFVHFLGNAHIYMNHIDALSEQIKRTPFSFPSVSIRTVRESIDDYVLDDFIVNDYTSHEIIKMKMTK